jgi:hypothetical protein
MTVGSRILPAIKHVTCDFQPSSARLPRKKSQVRTETPGAIPGEFQRPGWARRLSWRG